MYRRQPRDHGTFLDHGSAYESVSLSCARRSVRWGPRSVETIRREQEQGHREGERRRGRYGGGAPATSPVVVAGVAPVPDCTPTLSARRPDRAAATVRIISIMEDESCPATAPTGWGAPLPQRGPVPLGRLQVPRIPVRKNERGPPLWSGGPAVAFPRVETVLHETERWGGWDSNPRPTDYESAALTG